jgi:fructose-1,6-bisphosphatase
LKNFKWTGSHGKATRPALHFRNRREARFKVDADHAFGFTENAINPILAVFTSVNRIAMKATVKALHRRPDIKLDRIEILKVIRGEGSTSCLSESGYEVKEPAEPTSHSSLAERIVLDRSEFDVDTAFL